MGDESGEPVGPGETSKWRELVNRGTDLLSKPSALDGPVRPPFIFTPHLKWLKSAALEPRTAAPRSAQRFVEKMCAAQLHISFVNREASRKARELEEVAVTARRRAEAILARWREFEKELSQVGSMREQMSSMRTTLGRLRAHTETLERRLSDVEERGWDRQLQERVKRAKEAQAKAVQRHRDEKEAELRQMESRLQAERAQRAEDAYSAELAAFRTLHGIALVPKPTAASEAAKLDRTQYEFVSTVTTSTRRGWRCTLQLGFSTQEDPTHVATAFAAQYDLPRDDKDTLIAFLQKLKADHQPQEGVADQGQAAEPPVADVALRAAIPGAGSAAHQSSRPLSTQETVDL